jgi:hypothetical protein
LNFEAGLANGAGNANILLADDPCVRDPFNCDDADTALNVSLANHYTGVLNGSLNANNIGTGSATNIDIENFAHGLGNLSGNGNVVGNCEFFGPNENPEFDPETQSRARAGDGQLICNHTGDATSVNINNTAFGNLNGSGNGNALGGLFNEDGTAGNATSVMVNNRLFGNLNAAGNGNAFGDGEDGNAVIVDNFISGNGSGTGNGNGSSGNAVLVNNPVMGNESLSGNGNVEGGAGNAELINNTVIGNRSAVSFLKADAPATGDRHSVAHRFLARVLISFTSRICRCRTS